MVGRPQFRADAVALLATKRQLDFAVAHQAIGHLRHVHAADGVRRIHAAVTGDTRVCAVKLTANVTRGRKILTLVNGLRDYGRHVAELQMFFVAEVRQQRLGRRRNRNRFVARLAGRR